MHTSFVHHTAHRTSHRTAHRTDQRIPNRLQRHIAGILLILIAAASSMAGAVDVPPALAPWQGWVLDQHRDAQCTRVALNLSQRICVWPGRLQLAVSEKGGSFSQTLQVEAAGWVGVPGDREQWPQSMTLNGRSASALERNGLPVLWLEAGDYVLRGNFEWSLLPQSLALPADTALLDLNVNGAVIAAPNLERNRLWLRAQNQAAEAGAHNTVKVEVFRKIRDDIPRVIETSVRLTVSGKARELVLGRLLLPNAEPLRFDAPLPARIEADGSLRVQARAGEWMIQMDARLLGDVNEFAMERQGDDWPTQEVWVFDAGQSLRRAKVDGAPSVDPSQLDLPPGFANLPTYLLDAQTRLILTQQYRGDATPAPNELALDRSIWLDFAGAGATVKDRINGRLAQGWRLDAQPALALGRVRVDGEPRLVTQLDKGGASGVEIRNPVVNLEALARVENIDQLNASGWQTDFNGVNVRLLVPPGWKLWHASGPDQVSHSWVSRWNLWAIFLSLLIVAAVFRLLDWRWALVSAFTVALVYHERLGLIILLLPLLVAIALLQVVSATKARQWIQRIALGFGVILSLAILAFAVDQIRRAIYPQLEVPYSIVQDDAYTLGAADSAAESAQLEAVAVTAMRKSEVPASAPAQIPPRKRYEASDNTQTGPGEPRWSWKPITLSWSGPVKADQPLHLYLTGNWVTRLLKILNVLLIAALAFGVVRAVYRSRPTSGNDAGTAGITALSALVAMIFMASAMAPATAHAQVFPPADMLDELAKRLLREPDCAPDCSAMESALIQVNGDQLNLRLRVAVETDLAVPLPVAGNWQARTLLVDGLQNNNAIRQPDGSMLLPLRRGNHDITIEGVVSGDDIALQFAQRPHIVKVTAPEWDVFGVKEGRLASNNVQLQKRQRSAQQDTLLQAPAQPFVIVRRQFVMGLDWALQTTVQRVAPQQGAINLAIPTLPGESIVGGGVEAKDGIVQVSLASQQHAFIWQSQLSPLSTLKLLAPATTQWVEVWSIDASERWHVDGDGIPPVKNESDSTVRSWQPWPGETLTLMARQPLAVKGATTTIESSALTLTPGKRTSSLELSLAISSSIGGDYRIALREKNVVKKVLVNGADISQGRSDEKLLLPLVPGDNRVQITWELERGVDSITRTPEIVLDTAAANINLTVQLPADRWPLWVSGPRIGPEMLYWGVLVVIVGVAFALAAITRRFGFSVPLRSWHWLFLLIGISSVNTIGSLPVLLWFAALETRHRAAQRGKLPLNDSYYLIQVGVVFLTFLAAVALVAVIPQSLLSVPDMQVTGNGSSNYFYSWYQDRSGTALPQALVVSVPLWCYRIAMLVWSLWLAFALLRWAKWGWNIFAEGGVWPTMPKKSSRPSATLPPESGDTK